MEQRARGTWSDTMWRPILPPLLADRAEQTAMEVARRITGVSATYAMGRAPTRAAYPSVDQWAPRNVAQGDAGIALLAGQVDACCPGLGWDVVAHSLISIAAHDAEHAVVGSGLFQGLAGLGLVAATLSRDGTRYQRLLAAVDQAVVADVGAHGRRLDDDAGGIPVSYFDVMSGLSGIGAYLLRRIAAESCQVALEGTLRELVTLAMPANPPRWWTPAHFLPTEIARAGYPNGNLNCGLAHGIPGPLALLALAMLDGVRVPGQEPAMRSLADWLVAYRIEDRWGSSWPDAIPLTGDNRDVAGQPSQPGTDAWCYGSAGVARSLWLAGTALGDASLQSFAVAAMDAVYARRTCTGGIDSPTFCHGIAGLLQVTLRFAHDTGLPSFTAAASDLTEQLLSRYDPERPFGYSSLEPDGRRADRRGLLDGASGVALTLLAASTQTPPFWDRLFVLA